MNTFNPKEQMFVSWEEDGLVATALVEGIDESNPHDGYFNCAINCRRDGQMGSKDKDGYYDRVWYSDYINSCGCNPDTMRPATKNEVIKFITMTNEMAKWEEALLHVFYESNEKAWFYHEDRGHEIVRQITEELRQADAAKDSDILWSFMKYRKGLSNLFGADFTTQHPELISAAVIADEIAALRLEMTQLQIAITDKP